GACRATSTSSAALPYSMCPSSPVFCSASSSLCLSTSSSSSCAAAEPSSAHRLHSVRAIRATVSAWRSPLCDEDLGLHVARLRTALTLSSTHAYTTQASFADLSEAPPWLRGT